MEIFKNKHKKHEISFTSLEEEIKIEEESRKLNNDNVENFKKAQQPKKLKNKILAWILGGSIFAGAVAGSTLLYKDQTDGNGAYNNEIQKRYEQVDEKLTKRLCEDTQFDAIQNSQICQVKFLDNKEEETKLRIIYKGNYESGDATKGIAVYNILEDYYNSLVNAEEEGNVLYYLDALEKIFEEMQFIGGNLYEPVSCDLLGLGIGKSEENANKFNELFALENNEDENIIRQVGFLPYDVEIVDFHVNNENHQYTYTYRITGISYCETKDESGDNIDFNEDLIRNSEYDKTHIKTYHRDILFSSVHTNEYGIDMNLRLSGDIWLIMLDMNEQYKIETTLFEETNLIDLFKKLKDRKFNFEKPEDFNIKDYIKNREEMENAK